MPLRTLKLMALCVLSLAMNQFVAAQTTDSPQPAASRPIAVSESTDASEPADTAEPMSDRKRLILHLGHDRIEQLMNAGKFDLAERELGKLVDLYPNERAVLQLKKRYDELRLRMRFVLLKTLFREGKLDEVKAIVVRLKQKYPEDERVQKLIAQLPELEQRSLSLQLAQAVERQDQVATERLLRQLLESNPESRNLALNLAGLLLQQQRHAEATWVLRDFLATTPNDTEVLVLLGQAYLAEEQTNSAYRTFSLASRIDRNTVDLNYWIGRTLLQCERPFSALGFLSCGPVSSDEVDWVRSLSRGGAYAQIGALQEAANTFCYVSQNCSSADLRRAAGKAKVDLDDAVFEQDRFSGTFRFGVRHDSNPGVIPAVNALGIPIGSSDSFANTIALNTNLKLWRTYEHELSVGYNFSQTVNYSAHQFDLTDNQVYVNHQKRMLWNGKPLIASATVNYGHLALDGVPFLSRVEVLPTLNWQQNDFESWTLLSRYRNYDFLRQGALASSPFDLDSHNFMLGANKQRRLCAYPQVTLSAGYQADINWADGSNFDYHGHRVFGAVNWKSRCECWEATLSSVFYYRDFENPNSVVGTIRDDNQWIATCQLQRNFNDDWKLYGLWNFDLNESNIGFNEYRRNIVEVGVSYEF